MATRSTSFLVAFALMVSALFASPPSLDLPAWVGSVGAKSTPPAGPVLSANAFGAVADGTTLATAAIQRAIDTCALRGGGTVTLAPGRYLTGALFVKSGVRLRIDAGVTLVATTDEKAYPLLPTRIGGIEMVWPAALINVYGQHNAEIDGEGAIDGQGPYWWKKFWDLRAAYIPRGLRWAADYDCQRLRLITVWKSQNVTVSRLHLHRSGFWTVQITYSDHVTVDGITIADNFMSEGIKGASTDGVDVDSSRYVLVQHCDIDNNDDDICLKAGRDADGLRVNRPTEYVVIRDNVCRRGGGVVSFGSETAGVIRHVVAYRDVGIGTSEGLRFKSTPTRGGGVEDVLIRDVTLTNVPRPFTFTLDWNPAYSDVKIPDGMKNIPAMWRAVAAPVQPPERGYPFMRDITIANVRVTGARQIMTVSGLPQKPLGAVRWENITAQGTEAGSIRYAHDWTMSGVQFRTSDGKPVKSGHCDRVELPVVSHE